MKSSRLVLLMVFSVVGCTSLPYNASEPTFQATENIFQKMPIWDSTLLTGQQLASSADQSVDRVRANNPDVPHISRASSPGLWALLKQVDRNNRMLLPEAREAAIYAELTERSKASVLTESERKSLAAIDFANANQNPLPSLVKNEPLTRAYIISLAAAFFNSRLQTLTNDYRARKGVMNTESIGSDKTGLPDRYELSETVIQAFSVKNFQTFGEAFLQENLNLIQQPSANQTRLNQFHNLSTDPNITFELLAFQYFSAYYKGNFVDRDGGTLAKPTLGTTISDTTISNAATVALEAMFDYAVLSSDLGGSTEAIKAPIVYDDSGGAVKWQTAKGGEPTLATVIQTMLKNNGSDILLVGNRASLTKLNRTITLNLLGNPTGGAFTITVKGASSAATSSSIAFNAAANTVQAAILALHLPETVGAVASGNAGGPYQITLSNGVSATVQADGSGLTGGNNVYALTIEGKPTGGTFTLTVGHDTTKGIVFNAPAGTVAAALGALATAGNWPDPVVTGGAGGPYQITLPSSLSMTASPADLTGGGLIKPKLFALEEIAKNGAIGITPAKIKVIRFIQGIAGDGAQGLSGLIMRTFGGVHIGLSAGLGLLGKVSVGDNNTLANLLEASVGTIATRSTEVFTSSVLYDVTYQTPATASPNDPTAVQWLKYVTE
jgi:hypothetical protein